MEQGSSLPGVLALVAFLLILLLRMARSLPPRAETLLLALTGVMLFSIGTLLHG